jgi:serine/threonine protein kinase
MTTQNLHRGSRFGSIRLIGLIGSGGFSDVYLGELKSGQEVAVKVLRSEVNDSVAIERFKREAAILRRVSSRAVTRYIDSDFECGSPWIATEFIDGPTLRQFKNQVGKLSVSQAVEVVRPIVEAMVEGHALGIIHRDINPDNILVTNQTSYLIDFGVSTLAEVATITIDGSRFGTPGFTAPERSSISEDTTAIDVFSIAAVFRWLISDIDFHDEANSFLTSIPELIKQGLNPDPQSRISLENFAAGLLRLEYAELQRGVKTQLPEVASRKVEKLRRRFEIKTVAGFVVVAGITASFGTYRFIENSKAKETIMNVSDMVAKFKPAPDVIHQAFSPESSFYLSKVDLPKGVDLFSDLQAGGIGIPDSYPILEKLSKRANDNGDFEIVLSPMSEGLRILVIDELAKPDENKNDTFGKIIDNRFEALIKYYSYLGDCKTEKASPEKIIIQKLEALAISSYSSCPDLDQHFLLLTIFVPEMEAIVDLYVFEYVSKPILNVKTVVESISLKRKLILDISKEESLGEKLNIQSEDAAALARVYPPRIALLLKPQNSVTVSLEPGMESFIQWFAVTSIERQLRKTIPFGSTIADRENKRSFLITNPLDYSMILIGVVENQGGNVFDEVTLFKPNKKIDPIIVELNSFIFKKLEEIPESDKRSSSQVLGIAETDVDYLDIVNFPNDYLSENKNQLRDETVLVGGVFTNIPTNWLSMGAHDSKRLFPAAPLYSPTTADFQQMIVLRPKVFKVLGPGVSGEFLQPPSDLMNCSTGDSHQFEWKKSDLSATWVVYTDCERKLYNLDFAGQPMTAPHIRMSFSKNGQEYLRLVAAVTSTSSLIYFGIFLEDIVFTNSILESVGKSTGSADEVD